MKTISDVAIITASVLYAVAASNMLVTEFAKILPLTLS